MTDSEQNRTPGSTGPSGPSSSATSGIPPLPASGPAASGGADVRSTSVPGRTAQERKITGEGEFVPDAQAGILAAERDDVAAIEHPGMSSPEALEREGGDRSALDAGHAKETPSGAALGSSHGGGTVPPAVPPAAGRDRDRDSDHSRTAMVLGGTAIVLALVLGAWTYNRFDRIESEVTRRLQTSEQRGAGIESSLQQSQNLVRDLQNRSSVLENRIAETAGLQAQLEKLYRERAEDTLEVLLVETEGAVSLASQQLALGANPQGVLAALEDIERRLARQNEARLGPVQAALLRDIEMLRVYPASDVSSLALRIDALIGALDHLPLLASIRNPLETSNGLVEVRPPAAAKATEASPQTSAASPSSATAPVGAAAPPPEAAPTPAPPSETGQDAAEGQGQAQAPAGGSTQVRAELASPAASQSSTSTGTPSATSTAEQAGAQSAADPQVGDAPAANEAGSTPPEESAASPQQASAQQPADEQASQTEPQQQQAQAAGPEAPATQRSAPEGHAPQPASATEQAREQSNLQPSNSPQPAPQQAASQPASQQASSQPASQLAPTQAPEPAPQQAVPQASTADSGSSRLTTAWNAVRKELRELFNVRRIDAPDAMLMSPQQSYFLRQNLRLMLLNARLALLTRNEEVYRADLERARRWIGSYYDAEHRNVVAVQAQLRQLIDARLVLEPPRIDESLAAVRLARTTVR